MTARRDENCCWRRTISWLRHGVAICRRLSASRIVKLVVGAPAGGGIDIVRSSDRAGDVAEPRPEDHRRQSAGGERQSIGAEVRGPFAARRIHRCSSAPSGPVTNALNAPVSYDADDRVPADLPGDELTVLPGGSLKSSKIEDRRRPDRGGQDRTQVIRYGHPGPGRRRILRPSC